jgi:hypothetical protein
MSTVLQFRQASPQRSRAIGSGMVRPCEIVIFPGVRIERHEVDLAHRLVESTGCDFEQFDGRPRHTS